MSRSQLQDNVVGEVTIADIIRPSIPVSGVGTGDVFATADTQRICSPNSIIKYININLETSLRDIAPEAPGFLEYAIVVFEEQESTPTVNAILTAGVGTQTLMDLCKNLFRGNCLWTNSFAVSRELPRVENITIKVPPKFCKMKRGMHISIIKNARTADVSDTTTDFRTMMTFLFKAYL